MSVHIHLPPDVEQHLRTICPNLEVEGREAMLIEFYRQDKISHHELGCALGLDRFETDGVLKQHNVTEDLLTPEEYEEDLRRIQALLETQSSSPKLPTNKPHTSQP